MRRSCGSRSIRTIRSRPEKYQNRPKCLESCLEIGGRARYTVCLMDALGAVLAPVRLQQTCWAFTVGRAPWGLAFLGGKKNCVRFHYMVRGSAWLNVDNTEEPDVALSGGDRFRSWKTYRRTQASATEVHPATPANSQERVMA